MFFPESNKHYKNKHRSLMFSGYKKENKLSNDNQNYGLNTQHNRQDNNYPKFDKYNIVINTRSNTTLNRNTDFKYKYYGRKEKKITLSIPNDNIKPIGRSIKIDNKPKSKNITLKNIVPKNIIPKKKEITDNNFINSFSTTRYKTIKTIDVNKKKHKRVPKKVIYEKDKEIKTTLSFDTWKSKNDILDQIKTVEKRITELRLNMKKKKVKNEMQNEIQNEIISENRQLKIENAKIKNQIIKNKHPYKKQSKTFIEGDNIEICWTPNKWIGGVIDEITVGGLYYVRHMTERENNNDAEMTWTRSLVNPNQIRRK